VTSHVEASLASLSSGLLMRVANYLGVNELCTFDTSVSAKQLRSKFLSGLFHDTFLYAGAAFVVLRRSSEWHEGYARWLTLRRVVVNSVVLDENTTATALALYDTMNRVNPGLVSLTIHGDVTFPKDIAVRSAKTLHTLELYNQGTEQLRKLMGSVREWGSMGGSLQLLSLDRCKFGNEAVDFGNALTKLQITECSSELSTTPGDSLGCTLLLWGILHKCKNLKFFEFRGRICDLDLCLLARFCPDLIQLHLSSPASDTFKDAALGYVAMKCTKLSDLQLLVPTAFTDRTIQTIAANLVSLLTLSVKNLQLQNPRTLRMLAHGCPRLQRLRIDKGSVHVTEAELQYLVKNARKLLILAIGRWEHLDFRDARKEIQPFAAEELLQLSIDDPEALLSSHRDRLQVLSTATQQPDMDTVEKLRAASSNPLFTVTLL